MRSWIMLGVEKDKNGKISIDKWAQIGDYIYARNAILAFVFDNETLSETTPKERLDSLRGFLNLVKTEL